MDQSTLQATKGQRLFSEFALFISGGLFGAAMIWWSLRVLIVCGVISIICGMRVLTDDILEAIHQSKGNE